MATAKKLPSGSWRVQVSLGKDPVTGKRIVQSVTAPTKREAEYEAAQLKLKHKIEKRDPQSITLGDAITKYIERFDALLSPATIRSYKSMREHRAQAIMDVKLKNLSRETIQRTINAEAKEVSPKTVRNVYGLITSTLREYHPDLYAELHNRPIRLPQAEPKEQLALEPDEIRRLFKAIRGQSIEIPVLLATWLCMSRSEIAGLRWDHVDFDRHTLRVDQSKIVAEKGTVVKTTKTRYRNRTLTMPEYIEKVLLAEKEKSTGDFVIPYHPCKMYDRLKRICKNEGLPQIRFHDLRHSSASVMLALNIPSYYAQRRGGWATDNMLKNVYGHTLETKRNEFDDVIDAFFERLSDEEKSV